MERSELMELVEQVGHLARRAGDVIISCRDREREEVECKPDGSPVTLADREAHDLLAHGLHGLDRSIPLISEEDSPGKSVPAAGKFWLVDPLDGTLGYLRCDGQFTVNVALAEAGEVLAGVILAPDSGAVYSAARGAGSRRENGGGGSTILDNSLASGPLTAALTNTSHSGRMRAFLDANGVAETIKCSSSLKICYVAERRADIYPRFGRTALWDTAAGAVIAREAGCAVENLRGEPLRYDPAAGLFHHGFMIYDSNRIKPVVAGNLR